MRDKSSRYRIFIGKFEFGLPMSESETVPPLQNEPLRDDHVPEFERSPGEYQVVARRYRPQGFGQLVGQNHVAQALSNAILTGRIGHAYLFTGARGVGKTSSARIFAKALNCVHGPTSTPCNTCEICEAVSTGEDVDVLEIDGASNRGIDEIRQLRQNASVKPSRARYKIYIIDEVHMLTREAFNALLKTLEEPPEHVKFIFCTTEPSKIPITILSRCQRFDFAGIDAGAIADRLAEIAANEGITANEGVFETLARRASGSMRDAQSLLEQLLSFAPEHISLADVHGMLGTADDQRLFRIMESMAAARAAEIFVELDAAAQEGVDFGIFTEQLLSVFRDLMVSASGGDQKLLMYCSPGRYDQVKQLARDMELTRILAAMQILDQAYSKMRYSTQGRILLELALVRICHLEQLKSVATLLEQLRSGNMPIQIVSPSASLEQRATEQKATVQQSPEIGDQSREVGGQRFSDMLPPVLPPAQKKTEEFVPATDVPLNDEQEIHRIWEEMAKSLPAMVAANAVLVQNLRFEPPMTIVAVFPSTQGLARSYCENEETRIQKNLRDLTGQNVLVKFETVIVQEEPKKGSKSPVNSTAQKLRMMAEAADHPLIKKAGELFGANMTDIKPK